jgi:NTE family protein
VPHRAFVAFSGGGAKGIVHVGALKALEARNVTFLGFAGTSAGSIVATLAAAGFKADDLIHAQTGATIMARLGEIDPGLAHATDLFGPGGWWRVRLFRWVLRRKLPVGRVFPLIWLAVTLFGVVVALRSPTLAAWVYAIAWLALSFGLWLGCRYLLGGLASVHRFRDALQTLLQRQVFPSEPGRVVRLGDFGRDGRPSLKIVSANLTTRRLHLFSADRTPETPVADAVAASICLPVVFQPIELDGEMHVDGGIVSNLPAWPFDEERELDPEALTIAVEIEEATAETPPKGASWLPAAIRTALSGAGELNLRASGPVEQLALPTRLDLLDFDLAPERAAREVRDVAALAGLRLDRRLFRLPEIYRNACAVAQALAQDALGILPSTSATAPRVRVAVGRMDVGYARSLRMSYSVGYDGDSDEALLLPLEGSVAGAAWREVQSRLEIVPLQPDLDLRGDPSRRLRNRRWREQAWVLCIPILDDATGAPRLLVQLDGNAPLPRDEETEAALTSVEEAVKDFFNLVLQELRELEDDHGLQEQHL